MFSRITAAGLVLNFVAVPVMGIVQIAGMIAVAGQLLTGSAEPASWIAHMGATVLVDSSRLVDVLPWLTTRVPPPAVMTTVAYYVSVAVALAASSRALRLLAVCAYAFIAGMIVTGLDLSVVTRPPRPPVLTLTMFDVGQAESMLIELPDKSTTLVDAAGAPFGSGTFDIGGRVLAPGLWSRGIRRLDALLVTHGDPDHLGGARAVVEDFVPASLWEGVVVPRHGPTADVRAQVIALGGRRRELRAGHTWSAGATHVRVLHPPAPDWERPRVRNDDSLVLEILLGDVALLLTGDISAEVEREITPHLTPAKVRILKVAHHGSRTSTSAALLDRWRPQYALISAGRGNRFGHPAPAVITRLEAIGARVYRTDLHGQITLTTDGQNVEVRTFVGDRR